MTDEIKWDGKDAGYYASGVETRIYPITQSYPPILLTEEAWAFLAAEVTRRQGRDQAALDARRLEDKRDAFAAAALTGLLAYSNRPPGYGNAADVAWEVADAMMGARERVPTRETRK